MKFFRPNKKKYIKRIFKFSVLIFLIEIFSISPFLETNKKIYANDLKNDQIKKQKISREISDIKLIAKEISVAIYGATQGTGVLYQRNEIYHPEIIRFIGYEYKIITAWHVVKDNTSGEEISLILKDGTEYSVEISDIKRIEGLDFAVIKFISRKKYKTSFELNPEEFNIPRKEDKVFIAGFPLGSNNQLKIAEGDLVAETFWGEEGYDLFYDAPTVIGMSGGPILNDQGYFIGIHGRGEKDSKKSNFRGYTVKTGVNLGLRSSNAMQLEDWYKSPNLSEDKPNEESLEALNYFKLKAETEIRKNNDDYASAISYYDKAIAIGEKIFSDDFLENYSVLNLYLERGKLKAKAKDFISAKNDFQNAKRYSKERYLRILIKTTEIPFYAEIGDYKNVEILAKEFKEDLIEEMKEINNINDNNSNKSEFLKGIINSEKSKISYQGMLLSMYIFAENALSNISKEDKIKNLTEGINAVENINIKHENLYILYNQRAKLKESQKNYQGALLDFNKALKLSNSDTNLLLDRAKLKLKLKDIVGAINDINKSIEINDLNINSYLLRAAINADNGKEEEAYDDIEKIIKLSNDQIGYDFTTSDINYQLGQIFEDLKDYEAAEKEYSKVIKIRKASLLDNTPVNLDKNKRTDYQLKEKGEVINNELLNKKKLAYWGRAIARRKLNKLSDAILDYKKVLEIDPKNISALENLGDLFQQQGNYNEALEYFNKAIELVSNNAYIFSKRGYLKVNLRNYNGAIQDLSKSIELDPEYPFAYASRGNAKIFLEDYKGAIQDLSKSIELDPEYPFAYASRAYVKSELEDYEGAIQDSNKAIDINKNYLIAIGNRAWYKYKINDLEGAINDSNKVLSFEKNNGYVLYTRGLTKYKLGDLINGCLDLKRASNLDIEEAINYLKSEEGKWCNKD